MTLIECFTESHIDNIAACLRLHPETLVMVGSEDTMRQPVRRYRELLKKRGLSTQIHMCNVQGKTFGDICTVFEKLVRTESPCVIDLTGGDEPVIMAVGAVLAGSDSRQLENIHVQKFDYRRDAVLDCICNNCQLPREPVSLTVEELVALHGGSLHPNTYQPPVNCSRDDLEPLWSIVSEAPRDWNRAIMLLNEFESRADSKMQVFLPLEQLRGSIPNFDEKEGIVRALLDKLQRRGIIDKRSSQYALEYTYSSSMLRYCTLKAGNVLEIKALLEGRAVLEKGAPFFQDCRTSVSIDWDGIVHKSAKRIPETRNEVDVVLMHGTTPLFISCKNGAIGEGELYKLHTVASRFGGPYARKMLIATDLHQKSAASSRSFIQRAWDMDIFLVSDAAELSKDEWQQVFRNAMQ